jgi:dethiobiotin synthetase
LIIAVTGTGTGVGKTTVAVAMVRLLRARFRVGAWKPIETGGDADGRALGEASGSDAGPSIVLRTPVAPSVAARREGRAVEIAVLARESRKRSAVVDRLVVELPGGLYSPLDDEGRTNSELLVALRPDVLLLVASNRLGVLHDVEACRRAMRADGLRLDAVVLTGRSPDESVATNAVELARSVDVAEVPRPEETAALARWLTLHA